MGQSVIEPKVFTMLLVYDHALFRDSLCGLTGL
jgi:hypothetical protein